MRSDLADRLLAKVMDWDANDVSKFRPDIDILSQMKYDEYQQYFPGLRFTESLASWLYKMDFEDRSKLFLFVRNRLIFISAREMNQLVSQAFPDFIRPRLYKSASELIGCSEYSVNKLDDSLEYKAILRKSLFLGLSDGARTDVMRRFNPFISHEQVLPFYLIPEEKFQELKTKLKTDLEKFLGVENHLVSDNFSNLILLDDFTASGTSYFKYDEKEDKFRGKVNKILNKLLNENNLAQLFDTEKIDILLIIYIATTKAANIINSAITKWIEKNPNAKINIQFEPIYQLPDSINVTKEEVELCKLLEKYYDPHIESDSYLNGKHDAPYLGFDECGLPIILNHNTPNNSIPILWNETNPNTDEVQLVGLFPRVSRHKK